MAGRERDEETRRRPIQSAAILELYSPRSNNEFGLINCDRQNAEAFFEHHDGLVHLIQVRRVIFYIYIQNACRPFE